MGAYIIAGNFHVVQILWAYGSANPKIKTEQVNYELEDDLPSLFQDCGTSLFSSTSSVALWTINLPCVSSYKEQTEEIGFIVFCSGNGKTNLHR